MFQESNLKFGCVINTDLVCFDNPRVVFGHEFGKLMSHI